MPKRKDLTGRQFDELKVIEMLYNYQNKRHTYCKCIGIDGNEYIVRADALVGGKTHTIHGAGTAGTPHDISGNRYGRLIAIKPTDKRASNGEIIWECKCDCGNVAYVGIGSLKQHHTTSCGCAKQDFIESCKIDIIGKKFGKLTPINVYSNTNKKRRTVECLCDCGNIHICTITDLTSGHTTSCGCLKQSVGEKFIEDFLLNNNIQYDKQKRFKDCKNIRPLPFDFYLPQYNTCIEYDGEQHFRPVKYWGGQEKFERYRINDEIKNTYCINNGITLIRISYKLKNNEIIKILNNIIYPATITA